MSKNLPEEHFAGNTPAAEDSLPKKLNHGHVVIIRDPQLQRHYERAVSVVKGCPPEQLPIRALLDAWHWFHLNEGDESPRATEAIEHLLSPALRPALRQWFQRWGADMNIAANEFRHRLGGLAGESLG